MRMSDWISDVCSSDLVGAGSLLAEEDSHDSAWDRSEPRSRWDRSLSEASHSLERTSRRVWARRCSGSVSSAWTSVANAWSNPSCSKEIQVWAGSGARKRGGEGKGGTGGGDLGG